MLIFKYDLLRRRYKWDAGAQSGAKKSKQQQRGQKLQLAKFSLAQNLSRLGASSFLSLSQKNQQISRWFMSGMLERASSLLACSDWDVFKSAYCGDNHKAQDGYTLFLSSGELPTEVMNYIDSLPKEETYL